MNSSKFIKRYTKLRKCSREHALKKLSLCFGFIQQVANQETSKFNFPTEIMYTTNAPGVNASHCTGAGGANTMWWSIGGNNKQMACLYDIGDDLTQGARKNHTLLHLIHRIGLYDDQKFDYKIYTVKLKG